MAPGRFARIRFALALAVLLFVAALPALAAGEDEDLPYLDVPALTFTKPWVQWLIGAGFVAVCLLIAFKNPHRSHLD